MEINSKAFAIPILTTIIAILKKGIGIESEKSMQTS